MANRVLRGPGSWIFNNTILKDQDFMTLLRNEIGISAEIKHTFDLKMDFWDYLKMNIQSVSRMYSSAKAKSTRKEIFEIKKEIEQIERVHTFNITEATKLKLNQLQEKMANFEKNKIEGMKLR